MRDEEKTSKRERLHTFESERSLNPEEKQTNKLKNIYLILSITKTCIGLYILYESKNEIANNTEEIMKHMFQFIILYTFIWPLALVFSTLFFVGIHFIDIILQITKPRRHNKNSEVNNGNDIETTAQVNTNSFNTFSNAKFFYTTIFTFIVVSYIVSIPIGFILLSHLIKKQLLTKSLIFYKVLAFYGLIFFISIFLCIFIIYYMCYLKRHKKKIEIDDAFLNSIEKKIENQEMELNQKEIFSFANSSSNVLRPSHDPSHKEKNSKQSSLGALPVEVMKPENGYVPSGKLSMNNMYNGRKTSNPMLGNSPFSPYGVKPLSTTNALMETNGNNFNFGSNNGNRPSISKLGENNEDVVIPLQRLSKKEIINQMKDIYSPDLIRRNSEGETSSGRQHPIEEFEIDNVIRNDLRRKFTSTKSTVKIFNVTFGRNTMGGMSSRRGAHNNEIQELPEKDTSNDHDNHISSKNSLEVRKPRTPKKNRKTIII